MNKKLIVVALLFILCIAASSIFILGMLKEKQQEQMLENANRTVTINEIKHNIQSGDTDKALEVCDEMAEASPTKSTDLSDYWMILIPAIISIMAIIILVIYLDVSVLRPFRELKEYANDVAQGKLDEPLKATRGNYFGEFTWAFDNLRRELKKSRSTEREAIENNKTVIATLSHDIKTPVASIRAYAEAFEANMDSSPEKRQKYLSVLMEKCDEVTNLTNDLFIHSISEMNRLETNVEMLELVTFIDNDVRKLFVEDEAEIILPEGDEIWIDADPKRLLQIVENLKNNAEKYAKSKIKITLERDDASGSVCLHFRDFGPGIPDDEIPFITGKFYRGKNAGDENGSGLGLYIVKELMAKMGGETSILNRNPGLEIVLTFPEKTE